MNKNGISTMQMKRNLPFQNLSKEAWQNLVIAAFLAFYAGQVLFDAAWNNYCGNLAIDYCAFWSAGKIANQDGYGQVYSLEQLWKVQQPIVSKYMTPGQYAPVPVPYLAVFIVPFQLFALLKMIPSFWLWTTINIIGTVIYLMFFARKTSHGKPPNKRTLLLAFLSLPVFLNLFQGQVNLWLMICAGEFFRHTLDSKPFQAGLWLGGLLLKPQILILIIPALFFKRFFPTIYGFSLSAVGLGIASFLLGGWNAIQALILLLVGYSGGLPSNNPQAMMNWRMVAANINTLTNSPLGWWLAIPCLIITLAVSLYLWKFSFHPLQSQFPVAILGIFAGTFAITWHSHFSMTMIVIPLLVYLVSQNILPEKIVSFWFFVPPSLMLLVYLAAPFVKVGLLPTGMYPFLNLLTGLRGLILNMVLLWWVILYLKNDFVQARKILKTI